jgi:hypothetical protein
MAMRQLTLSAWIRRPHGPGHNKSSAQPHKRDETTPEHTAVNGPGITVVHWNAVGIEGKKLVLQTFLRRYDVDVMCIQESHLKPPKKFTMAGYECFRHDRPIRQRGGIITLAKKTIPAVEIDRSDNTELEHLTVRLLLGKNNVTITNCCSPPKTKLALHRVKPLEHNHLFDLNCHSPSWKYESMDQRGEEIKNWIGENRLVLIKRPDDKPTYFSKTCRKSSTLT